MNGNQNTQYLYSCSGLRAFKLLKSVKSLQPGVQACIVYVGAWARCDMACVPLLSRKCAQLLMAG